MYLNSEDNQYKQLLLKITNASQTILQKLKPELINQTKESQIPVNFITDPEIQALNLQYRQKDKPTDVLSWSFIDQNLLSYELAGEIYVSLDTATKQAQDLDITLEQRLKFLIVHGLLHVFHYDHNDDLQEAEMDNVTNQILELL